MRGEPLPQATSALPGQRQRVSLARRNLDLSTLSGASRQQRRVAATSVPDQAPRDRAAFHLETTPASAEASDCLLRMSWSPGRFIRILEQLRAVPAGDYRGIHADGARASFTHAETRFAPERSAARTSNVRPVAGSAQLRPHFLHCNPQPVGARLPSQRCSCAYRYGGASRTTAPKLSLSTSTDRRAVQFSSSLVPSEAQSNWAARVGVVLEELDGAVRRPRVDGHTPPEPASPVSACVTTSRP